jgi:hypothetical protein
MSGVAFTLRWQSTRDIRPCFTAIRLTRRANRLAADVSLDGAKGAVHNRPGMVSAAGSSPLCQFVPSSS